MKQTQKYAGATLILSFPHNTQDELYAELNRLGWWWNRKAKQWERDDRPAKQASALIKIRVLAANSKVSEVAQHFIEVASDMGLRLIEQSGIYPCRAPNQNESRIYLTFEDD